MTEENHEKTPVRLVGTGIRTRDLPNASLVHYHGATSLGHNKFICICLLLIQAILIFVHHAFHVKIDRDGKFIMDLILIIVLTFHMIISNLIFLQSLCLYIL